MKTETLKIRLSLEEKKAFLRSADISGIPLSAWIRERLRIAAIRELEGVGHPIPFLQPIPLRSKKNE